MLQILNYQLLEVETKARGLGGAITVLVKPQDLVMTDSLGDYETNKPFTDIEKALWQISARTEIGITYPDVDDEEQAFETIVYLIGARQKDGLLEIKLELDS